MTNHPQTERGPTIVRTAIMIPASRYGSNAVVAPRWNRLDPTGLGSGSLPMYPEVGEFAVFCPAQAFPDGRLRPGESTLRNRCTTVRVSASFAALFQARPQAMRRWLARSAGHSPGAGLAWFMEAAAWA